MRTEGDRKQAIGITSEDITSVTASLSQSLVHIESSEVPRPVNENFGVELKLSIHSPMQRTPQEIIASRIWFQVNKILPKEANLPESRPFCLCSIRN